MKKYLVGALFGALLSLVFSAGAILGGGLTSHNHSGSSSGGSNIAAVPIGVILDYGGGSTPSLFKDTDGTAVSRTTCGALFTAIGTTFGVGDGSTTFNLPNTQRRVLMGQGGVASTAVSNTVGSTGGAETLTTAQLAAHTHSTPSVFAGIWNGSAGANFPSNNTPSSAGDTPANTSASTSGSAGTGAAFYPPAVVVRKIIKADC